MTDTSPRTSARQPGESAATSPAEASPDAVSEALELGPRTPREVVTGYISKVRGGDPGALPAALALLALVVIFTLLSSRFLSIGNFANLTAQAGPFVIIAMGLIFVLLLGEIDLSAGTAGGACAVIMGLALTKDGHLHTALGTGNFTLLVIGMVAALAVAVLTRLWIPAVLVAIGLVLDFTSLGSNAFVAVCMAVLTGIAIGLLTGILVSKVGIPSFVVTLALYLGWQGVILQFEGQGSAIPVSNNTFINAIDNKNLSPALGWLMLLILVGGYALVTLQRSIRRHRQGLTAEPMFLVVSRAAALAIIGIVVVHLFNGNRSKTLLVIRGVPIIVPIMLVLMIIFTLVLTKTPFGRYVYAVGGNPEAARRAGINVAQIRIACFTITTGLAALALVVQSSQIGSVPQDSGRDILLYAVGAAVIGGTSLFGGRGRPRDALLGGLVIAIIPNGVYLLGKSASFNYIFTAGVLLAAASVDALSRKRSAATGR